jgi:hypothetical protein
MGGRVDMSKVLIEAKEALGIYQKAYRENWDLSTFIFCNVHRDILQLCSHKKFEHLAEYIKNNPESYKYPVQYKSQHYRGLIPRIDWLKELINKLENES